MFYKKNLKNGIRTLLAPVPGTKTVTILVLFGVGSRYEHKRINGISHFIEHMMFKGTHKRPTALSISKELDGVGAQYNAYTSKDVTGYWVKLDSTKLSLALDIVSDMLSNSTFQDAELQREKKVICEEIHMYKDNPIMYVDTLLEKIMFEPSSLGWDIAGDDKTVLAMTRNDLVKFRDAHYRGKNVVIGIAGNIEHEKGFALLESYFGKSRGGVIKENVFKKFDEPKRTKPTVLVSYKETEQVQIALGFYGYHYNHKDIYALSLLTILLGVGMSSRLFVNVREKHGLCYSIHAGYESFHDTGSFVVQAGLDKTRVHKAINLIMKELFKVKKQGVTKEELIRAKEYVRGKSAIQLEDSLSVASWYANQEVHHNELLTPEEKLTRYAQVSHEDIKRVAQKLFSQQPHLAVIGPYKDEKEFINVLTD